MQRGWRSAIRPGSLQSRSGQVIIARARKTDRLRRRSHRLIASRSGRLIAVIERLLDHPRLFRLRFLDNPATILKGLARHGRPIQYAHVPEPLALYDIWTKIAADPIAFEPPSAGFALDWRTLAAWRKRGIGFATLTHAAGISSTGDRTLDLRLPFDEPYSIPERTAAAIKQAKSKGGRIIAIGTTVVRAIESAA